MIRFSTFAFILAAAATMPAHAQTSITKLTVESVGAAVEGAGYQYSVAAAEDGSPLIEVDVGNSKAREINIQFFDCDAKGACEDILLWGDFALSARVTMDKINDWNARGRWTRAYVNASKDPVLEMDINATGGIGVEAVTILVNTYFIQTQDFATHLGL